MKTFKLNKPKTKTFSPQKIKTIVAFSETVAAGVNGKVLTNISVEDIEVKPQVRTVIENIDELAESMKSGQLLPITVIKSDGGKYVILQGERRWLAAKKAGLKTIEAIVVEPPASEDERIFGQLTENIQRENMKLGDLISSIAELIKLGHSQTAIAERLGKDRTYISRIGALSDAHEAVLELIRKGKVNDPQTAQILNSVCAKSSNLEKDLALCQDKEGQISRSSAQTVLEKLQSEPSTRAHKKVVAFEDRFKKKQIPSGFHKISASKPLNIQVEYLDENGLTLCGHLLPRLISDNPGEVCVLSEDKKNVISVPIEKVSLKTIVELK